MDCMIDELQGGTSSDSQSELDGGDPRLTKQLIDRASSFLKKMLPSTAESNSAAPCKTNSAVCRGQGNSVEQLSMLYDNILPTPSSNKSKQEHLQYMSFQSRTRQDPFYSPIMEEMYAQKPKHDHIESQGISGLTAKHSKIRNTTYGSDADSNIVKNFYPLSSKHPFAVKPKPNISKPSTPATLQKSKSKHKDLKRVPRGTTHRSSSPRRSSPRHRPPTTDGCSERKPNPLNREPSQSISRYKDPVVEKIQLLEREREQRRIKQKEIRAQEHALRMKDPGNVNWRFALMVNDYRKKIYFEPLKKEDPLKQSRIIVCIRKRPLNARELDGKEIDVITIPTKDLVLVHEPKAKLDMTKYLENHAFKFDYSFDENSSNELVYHFTTKPLIETVFEGGMATVFAYGQTGSGKTHTMGGNFNGGKQDYNNGIYMNVARDIFHMLRLLEYDEPALRLSVTFFEIYKGRVYDLLAARNEIKVMEDVDQQIQIVGLTELYTDYLEEVVSLIQKGNSARTSGKTAINPMSSRSHSVLQFILRRHSGDVKGPIHGKFSLIDLAGNERGVVRGAVTDRRQEIECAEINKSLLALKECIRALARSEGHIPFRGSKLTLVLKDTFMNANSRVCMIGTVSPGHSSCNCSLNTILYANRVKEFMAHDPMYEDQDNGSSH